MDGKQVNDVSSGASLEVKESEGSKVSQDDKKQESGRESVSLGYNIESGGDKRVAEQPGGTSFTSDTSGIQAEKESNEPPSEVKKPTASSMEKSPDTMEVAAIMLKIANTTGVYVSPEKDVEQCMKELMKVAPATPSPLMKELSNWRRTSPSKKSQLDDETGSEFQEHSAASGIIQAGKESSKQSSESLLKVENPTAESSIEKSPEKTVASILLGIAKTGKHGVSPKEGDEQSPKGVVPATPSPMFKQLSKWRSRSSSKKRQLEDGEGSENDLQNGSTPPKRNIFQRYKGKASINKQSSPAPDQSMDIDQPTASAETPSKVLTPSRKKSRFAGLINVTLSRLNSQGSPQRRIVWTSGERAEFETFPSGTAKELDAGRTEDNSFAAIGLLSGTTTKELDAGKTEDNPFAANAIPPGTAIKELDAGKTEDKPLAANTIPSGTTSKELDAGKTEDNPLAANAIQSGTTTKELDAGKAEDNSLAANGLPSGTTANKLDVGRIEDNPMAANGQSLVDKASALLPVEQENI